MQRMQTRTVGRDRKLLSESEHVRYMSSPVRLSSVTFVRPTQPTEIFGNVSMVPWPSVDLQVKFYGYRPREIRQGG